MGELFIITICAIGAFVLILLLALFVASFEDWSYRWDMRNELKEQQKKCPVCLSGIGVLMNEECSLSIHQATKNWCRPHAEKLINIRNMEHDLLDTQEPDPVRNLVDKINKMDKAHK